MNHPYTPADLEAAVNGDAWLGTCLLNETTYTADMMRARARLYATQREYLVLFDLTVVPLTDGTAYTDDDASTTIYAIDDESALRFARETYIPSAIATVERVTRTVEYQTIYENEELQWLESLKNPS